MKYSLTERQKDMLRSVAPSLKDNSLGKEWRILEGDDGISIMAFHDPHNVLRSWTDITQADLDDMEECGFLRKKEKYRYTVHVQKIIDGVNSNFGENEPNSNTIANDLTFAPIFGVPATTTQYKADVFVMMPFRAELKHISTTTV